MVHGFSNLRLGIDKFLTSYCPIYLKILQCKKSPIRARIMPALTKRLFTHFVPIFKVKFPFLPSPYRISKILLSVSVAFA